MSAVYVVTFDRLGRTPNPPELTVPVGDYENELVDAIEAHARKYCGSRDIEAICTRRTCDGQEHPLQGVVYAGGFPRCGQCGAEMPTDPAVGHVAAVRASLAREGREQLDEPMLFGDAVAEVAEKLRPPAEERPW